MNLDVLKINVNFNGRESVIHPVFLHNSSEKILIDAGFPGTLPLIEDAVKALGLSLEGLNAIIITHSDIDHIGGLHELKEKYPSAKVYSSEIEAQYISGKEKPIRLQYYENNSTLLSDAQKQWMSNIKGMFKFLKYVPVDITFPKDESPNYFEDVEIIHTPGHLPGHISVYVKDKKILISGDAITVNNGELDINTTATIDLKTAIQSIKKLLSYEINEIVCYHGGVLKGNIRENINKLINKYDK